MYKYISFDIENLEPLKLSQTSVQIDSEVSKSFIQGSALRGAFIANYMNLTGLSDLNERDKEMLLKGKIEFFNAYPKGEKGITLPFMRNLFTTKDEMKRFGDKEVMQLITRNDMEAFQKVKGIEFANYDFKNKIIESVKVKKVSSIHIKTPNNKEENTKLFTYEAIDKNTKFSGIIKFKEEYEAEVLNVMKKGNFYLGGSRGSGYGKCKISKIEVVNKNPQLNYLKEENIFEELVSSKCNEFYLFFTSDAILRNDFGVITNAPDVKFIENKLGITEAVEEEIFIDTDIFTGFNNKWGYRLPITNGIKAGSLIKYSFKGNLLKENLISFMEEGLGERKQEGFGRFILIPVINFEKILKGKILSEKAEGIILNDEEKSQLKLMTKRIYLNKINNEIPKIVLNIVGSIKHKRYNLPNSQWGKLINLMESLEGKSKAELISGIDWYFYNITQKTINRNLANTLSKIYIEDKKLEDFTKDFINITKEELFEKYCKPVNIGGIASDITEDDLNKIKVNILKEIFKLKLREVENNGV
ncbi:RAMP superfamily CRISPR-associated protein [Clostridium sp. B9]|uniref:RAMP superfamily CRISPR-associated protein n=1 Tax=Clostridium sp. B9 TaxID=3423224 RepID=UPI003D2EF46C